ncbi:hypothetical protein [Embleya sp. NPDC020886]|uniref:hypothetical protein n=1 Tax=Embleya sp. NPDC020886 TaxID=3363980 RepID=UPI0037ADD357
MTDPHPTRRHATTPAALAHRALSTPHAVHSGTVVVATAAALGGDRVADAGPWPLTAAVVAVYMLGVLIGTRAHPTDPEHAETAAEATEDGTR